MHQALPALHEYLNEKWLYYNTLESQEQTRYLCGLVSNLGIQGLVAVATSGGSLGFAKGGGALLSLVEKADLAGSRLMTAAVSGVVKGDSVVFTVEAGRRAASRKKVWPWHTADYWNELDDTLRQLPATRGLDREIALQELGLRTNAIYMAMAHGDNAIAKKWLIGGGNCVFSAGASMFTAARGAISCPLTYQVADFTNGVEEWTSTLRFFRDHGVQTRSLRDRGLENLKESLANLREGQMVYLEARHGEFAHATFVVRVDGKLKNVNNQGHAYDRAGLETLDEYEAYIRREYPSDDIVRYDAMITDLEIPASYN